MFTENATGKYDAFGTVDAFHFHRCQICYRSSLLMPERGETFYSFCSFFYLKGVGDELICVYYCIYVYIACARSSFFSTVLILACILLFKDTTFSPKSKHVYMQ